MYEGRPRRGGAAVHGFAFFLFGAFSQAGLRIARHEHEDLRKQGPVLLIHVMSVVVYGRFVWRHVGLSSASAWRVAMQAALEVVPLPPLIKLLLHARHARGSRRINILHSSSAQDDKLAAANLHDDMTISR